MNKEEFITYIESIGFRHSGFNTHIYNKYIIGYNTSFYVLSNRLSKNIGTFYLNNLTPLKRFERSIKIKKLLK